MKKVLFLLFLLSLPFLCFAQDATTSASPKQEDKQALQLTIKSDKQVYELGEEIYVTLKLINTSSNSITICKSNLPCYTDFNITDSEQKSVKYICVQASIPIPQRKDFITLQPSDFYEFKTNISECWGMNKIGSYNIAIKCHFDNFYQEDEKTTNLDIAWTGTLTSNTITIEVAKKRQEAQGLAGLPVDCDKLEKQIKELLEEVKSCRVDSDCIVDTSFRLGCPFGCFFIRSRFYDDGEYLSLIEEKIEQYHRECPICKYKCPTALREEDIRCRANRCIDVRFEDSDA